MTLTFDLVTSTCIGVIYWPWPIFLLSIMTVSHKLYMMWLTDGQTDGRTPYHNKSEVSLRAYKKLVHMKNKTKSAVLSFYIMLCILLSRKIMWHDLRVLANTICQQSVYSRLVCDYYCKPPTPLKVYYTLAFALSICQDVGTVTVDRGLTMCGINLHS